MAILDLLASLVDKSLVVAEERAGAVRYRLLETVRQYALERLLDAGEAEGVRDRHRDAMLELAETIAPQLHGPGQREWLEVLDGEAANLTAALDHAVETDGERALRLSVALTFWWRLRGSAARRRARVHPSARRRRSRAVLAARAGALGMRLSGRLPRRFPSGVRAC